MTDRGKSFSRLCSSDITSYDPAFHIVWLFGLSTVEFPQNDKNHHQNDQNQSFDQNQSPE